MISPVNTTQSESAEYLVGIVIPTYNSSAWIEQTLASVAAQTDNSWRCHVVDDGSTDDTVFRVQHFIAGDERFRISVQQNRGVSTARNRGAAEFDPQPKYLLFLDSDDLLEARALELLTDALRQHPASPAIYGLIRVIDEKGNFIQNTAEKAIGLVRDRMSRGKVMPVHCAAPLTFNDLVVDNAITTPGAVLIQSHYFRLCKGFDSDIHGAEDYDLWIRLSRLGPIAVLAEPVVRYRKHTTNSSNDTRRMFVAASQARRKALFSSDNTAQQRNIARRAFRAYHRTKAADGWPRVAEDLRARRWKGACRCFAYAAWNSLLLIRGRP